MTPSLAVLCIAASALIIAWRVAMLEVIVNDHLDEHERGLPHDPDRRTP